MATTEHPQRLGKYEILSVLGKGGMGIVYRARDAVIDRIVAIKTITAASEGIDHDQVTRLLTEARSAGRLHRPNIVTVFDYGEENGVAYIVMEYAEGVDLGQVIAGGQSLALPTKIDILLQICNGLGFAHEAGVVHRDMKPSNVRLTTQGVAKILDFGLARYDDTHLTKTGFISGTIAYMSPERMNGQAGKGDDIFALGAIAYEVLTYQRAFPGNSAPEVMFKIMTQPPQPPSAVAELPPQFDEIVLKCLDRESDNRYATAHDFAGALEETFAAAEVQAFLSSPDRSDAFRQGLQNWSASRKGRRTQATVSSSGTGTSSGSGSVRVSDAPTMSEMPRSGTSSDATAVVASETVGNVGIATRAGAAQSPASPGAAVTMVDAAPTAIVRGAQPTILDIPSAAAPTEIVAAPARKSRRARVFGIAAAVVLIAAVAAVIVRRQPAGVETPLPPVQSSQPAVTAASPNTVPSSSITATASADPGISVQKAQWELQQVSTRLQLKLDSARSRGIIPLSDNRWEDVLSRIAELRSSADSGDYQKVRVEGEKILKDADEIIRKPRKSAVTAVATLTPVKPQPQPSAAVVPTRPATVAAQPAPQPAVAKPSETSPAPQPAAQPSDARAEITSFMRRVASAYQSRDTSFFRDHHAAYGDKMASAIKSSPSVRVELDVETVEVRDADHARVVARRTDELPGGAPPQRVRLAYILERDGSAWKIVRTERP